MNGGISLKRVIIDRRKWLRIRPDGSEPILNKTGSDARRSIFLVTEIGPRAEDGPITACFMGHALFQGNAVLPEEMLNVQYPSHIGQLNFSKLVASAVGSLPVQMEREIALICDRKGPYANYSEDAVEVALKAYGSIAGYNIEFIN